MANEKPSTQTQPHGDAATRKKTETSVAEAGSSAEKKVTPKNAAGIAACARIKRVA